MKLFSFSAVIFLNSYNYVMTVQQEERGMFTSEEIDANTLHILSHVRLTLIKLPWKRTRRYEIVRPLEHWDRVFESHSGHGCIFMRF
jgi:hypothetical protein